MRSRAGSSICRGPMLCDEVVHGKGSLLGSATIRASDAEWMRTRAQRDAPTSRYGTPPDSGDVWARSGALVHPLYVEYCRSEGPASMLYRDYGRRAPRPPPRAWCAT